MPSNQDDASSTPPTPPPDDGAVPIEAASSTETSSSEAIATKAPALEAPRAATAAAAETQTPAAFRAPLRTLYWVLWFVALPFVFASLFVWGLTPASGLEHPGALGFIESIVRDQPVPVGIVAFTLFAMALWSVHLKLPLARYAHPPLRGDLPDSMRVPFQRARALLEEADAVLEKHAGAIQRDLTSREKTQLATDLDGLRVAMARRPFDEDSFVVALVRADGEVDVRLGRFRKSEVREYVESILVAVMVAMALRAFVVEAFKIPSGSMIPTLEVGDHIFVNKFTYGPAIPFTKARLWTHMPPERGDVMVFAYPEQPEQDFIKRVIAMPGDKLEAKNGHPIINGWEVPSCRVGEFTYTAPDSGGKRSGDLYVEFLADEAYLTLYERDRSEPYQGPFFVKPGEVYVMGDNRNNSHDSRMWWGGQGGGVPFDNIRGRALFVWLSISEAGIDWSRLGAPVMGRPRLPPNMRHLEPALSKCLREDRPPLTRTQPPPPR
jgi:signal peptidase I